MQSIFLLLLSITLTIPSVHAQSVGDLFKQMPTELLPGLSEGNKTMLLVDSGQTVVPYALGEIRKTTRTANHLVIKTSEVGTTELKLLPVAPDSVIICMVNTVCGDACDSRVSFYTTGWEKITDFLFLPEISGELFFDSSLKIRENYKYAVSLPRISLVSATFKENETDLLLTFHYKVHLTADQIEEVAPFLKSDTLLLHWDGTSFRE